MAMALVPAVLTLNVSPCSFSVAVDTTWRAELACGCQECNPRAVDRAFKESDHNFWPRGLAPVTS